MVLIFGVVAHALDLMVPEAIRKKLEPMSVYGCTLLAPCVYTDGSIDHRVSGRLTDNFWYLNLYRTQWHASSLPTMSRIPLVVKLSVSYIHDLDWVPTAAMVTMFELCPSLVHQNMILLSASFPTCIMLSVKQGLRSCSVCQVYMYVKYLKCLGNVIIVVRSEVNVTVNTYFSISALQKWLWGLLLCFRKKMDRCQLWSACLFVIIARLPCVFYLSNYVNSLVLIAHWIC